ncbi:MAG TPA: 23S rRNA (pseudouridine(1915)-N(3))-methyltransferase RlmH [Pyrinomonadaceae bacterium]|nr:23S rRNA (pseudouridine(1915)-N(3))-methyltransferase RlmH [Pyrinomonadaceae bacterium]
MKFRFIWVGKTRDQHYKALQEDYLQRLSHFVNVEVVEVKDSKDSDRRAAEGKRILEKVNQTSFVCLLDVEGKQKSSHGIAEMIEAWQRDGIREISFIIGGADGVSSAIAERANAVLSLSFLTFTHEMARVVLAEQLYRGFTIIKGFPYQK